VARLDTVQRAEYLNPVSAATIHVYDRLDSVEEGRAARKAVRRG
jgi:hypothetical protein